MQKENFLPYFYDRELRDRLWFLFNRAETEAKKFASIVNNNWIEIEKVKNSEDNKNSCKGEIFIVSEWNNLGAILHEVFHSAFHRSALWQSDKLHKESYNGYGIWGDGFCDAFRYFLEKELLNENEKSELFKNLKMVKVKGVRSLLFLLVIM